MCVMFCSQDMKAYSCLRHFFPLLSLSSSCCCFLLPAGIPCTSLITWFHAKVKSSSCLMCASLTQFPSFPSVNLSSSFTSCYTPPDIFRESAQREKILCGTGRSKCVCVRVCVHAHEKGGGGEISAFGRWVPICIKYSAREQLQGREKRDCNWQVCICRSGKWELWRVVSHWEYL